MFGFYKTCCFVFEVLGWYFRDSSFGLNTIFFSVKSAIIFIVIVLIRITTPRLKLESISRICWLVGLGILFVSFLPYVLIYFLV